MLPAPSEMECCNPPSSLTTHLRRCVACSLVTTCAGQPRVWSVRSFGPAAPSQLGQSTVLVPTDGVSRTACTQQPGAPSRCTLAHMSARPQMLQRQLLSQTGSIAVPTKSMAPDWPCRSGYRPVSAVREDFLQILNTVPIWEPWSQR